MPKLTSGIAGEPSVAISSGDKIPTLPKPMNCTENCAEWQTNLATKDPEQFGCEHAMRTQELKDWLALLRPSRIALQAGSTGRKKGGIDDEISI